MTGQMNENGINTAGKRTQAQFRRFLVERNMSEQTIKAYSYAVKPVFRRSTRKFPSFSSCHFFISFPASRFFLYLQQIFNALLGLFLLKKFF